MPDYRAPGIYVEETEPGAGPSGRRNTATTRKVLDPEDVVTVATHTTTLSLAVKLIDATTGEWPVGVRRVLVEDTDAKPVPSRTGFLLFLDLNVTLDDPDDPVTVSVDGGENYQDASREVIVSEDDPAVPEGVEVIHPLSPVVEFELTPSTA